MTGQFAMRFMVFSVCHCDNVSGRHVHLQRIHSETTEKNEIWKQMIK